MRKILFLGVLYLIFLNPSFGQTTDPSAINLANLNTYLDSIFSNVGKNDPGCAITIIEHGNILVRKNYGMANIENQVPFTHQSVVRMPYSEAREFISIAALLMEKNGILNLNDKVRTYFPDLPDWSESVTLWDLLNHRSGFVDEWATLLLMYNSMSNRFDTEQFLRLLYNQPTPEIEPGKGYMYSNSDFGLLRLIMEKASGKNLPDWIERRLFGPLNMKDTRMQKNSLDIIPNRATFYEGKEGGEYQHAKVQKTSPGGNYFILTTANDLEIWARVVKDPNSEISEAIKILMSNVRQMPGKENHFIIGYTHRIINNQQVEIHEGVNEYSYLIHIPSKGLSLITLWNKYADNFGKVNQAITDYLLQIRPEASALTTFITKPINVPESELSIYTGNYRWKNRVSWEGLNQPRKFSSLFIADGKLMMRYSGNYVIELTPVAKDIFYYIDGEDGFGAQFLFKPEYHNGPLQLTVNFDDGYPSDIMLKDTESAWQPTKKELAEFTGKFYSQHLDYYWKIELNENGKLILKSSNLPDTELEPDGFNQFHYIGESYPGSGYDRWILYNKNEQGTITHLTAWSGRVMHHRFEKQ
ncbi:serine hydrolase [Paucihalobacter ruber]|uniref:Serine hydrolase n=1 Tax=Paucihalobacter ruber TaxID=2567861 RepID=A0A506PNT6_9FLAO|nr:serine hydrolase [Paucihalobacter ruber]TPV35344.1 serine hydrolase [Paucihalobacter ruber]